MKYTLLFILVLSVACSRNSNAAPVGEQPGSPETPADTEIQDLPPMSNEKVIFVGGFKATQDEVNRWAAAARAKDPTREYEGYEYPPKASSSDSSAVAGAAANIKRAVADIDSHPDKFFIIAGHSSGAAISNRIAELAKDPSHFRLVTLDGFTPNKALQKRVDSTCWYGQNGNSLSANGGAMKSNCLKSTPYKTNLTTDKWGLHNLLYNKILWGGYAEDQLDPNLDWVEQ